MFKQQLIDSGLPSAKVDEIVVGQTFSLENAVQGNFQPVKTLVRLDL
jgi:hypothetical protein